MSAEPSSPPPFAKGAPFGPGPSRRAPSARAAALVVGAVLLAAAATGAYRQRPAPDAWATAPTFPAPRWWTTARERNGFRRLPVISRAMAAVAVVPARSRVVAVGEDATITYSDDGGATWTVAALDSTPPAVTPAAATRAPARDSASAPAPSVGSVAALARREQTLRDSVQQLQILQKTQQSTVDSANAASSKSPYGNRPTQQ